MKLWRPVGPLELRRIYETGMKAFPPRLIDQPIFYPVTNFTYAQEITRDWNRNGFVVAFEIPDDIAGSFEKKIVGGAHHEELWVPAAELPDFNNAIVGSIRTEWAVFQADFVGLKDPTPSFGGLHEAFHSGTARDQLDALLQNPQRLAEFCAAYNTLIYVTFPYWLATKTAASAPLLEDLQRVWQAKHRSPLCITATL